MTASPLATFSLPRNTSSHSLKSLGRRNSSDGPFSARGSFSRHSEGYGSSDTTSNSFSFAAGDSPGASLRRGRFSVSGSSSLERDSAHCNSTSSLYNHQSSCPVLGSKSQTLSRGRSHTLPPTSSLPRNFTISGRKVSRHDSYNAAVEGEGSCSGDGLPNDRGGRRRLSDTGTERMAVMTARRQTGDGGGGGRRGSVKKQGLSAVHEEDSCGRTEGVEPVAMSTTHVRGGVTRISTNSAQSTV